MLQLKSIRSILLVCTYACLSVFLAEKTVVPFLHQHHEVQSKVQGDSLQHATDCFACDMAQAMLDAELSPAVFFTFVSACVGLLQLFITLQEIFRPAIFSSLRAPPIGFTA